MLVGSAQSGSGGCDDDADVDVGPRAPTHDHLRMKIEIWILRESLRHYLGPVQSTHVSTAREKEQQTLELSASGPQCELRPAEP